MKTHCKHLIAGAGLALLVTLGGNAHAQVGTDTLVGWNVLGDAVSQGGAIILTTAFLDGGGDEAHNFSGNSAAPIGDVEAAAGVAPFTLDLPVAHFGTEGSVVSQSFTAAAGQTLVVLTGNLDLSVGSIMSVPATGNDMVGAWKP